MVGKQNHCHQNGGLQEQKMAGTAERRDPAKPPLDIEDDQNAEHGKDGENVTEVADVIAAHAEIQKCNDSCQGKCHDAERPFFTSCGKLRQETHCSRNEQEHPCTTACVKVEISRILGENRE